MPAANTPLDSLKNAVLRAVDGMDAATDTIGGSMCDHDHENELEWLDAIGQGLWLSLAEHVPGISFSKSGLVRMTPEARQAVHTYDDGSQVSMFIDFDGYCTHYYPRFDGPYFTFFEKFQRDAIEYKTRAIAYEAAHPVEAS